MNRLLTPEEKLEFVQKYDIDSPAGVDAICQAQDKKTMDAVLKWLHESCGEHEHDLTKPPPDRICCHRCRFELRKAYLVSIGAVVIVPELEEKGE